MDNSITIVEYKPEYQPYFERFNKAWLNEYFTVEPIDEYVLTHPEEAILQHGGSVLFACYEGKIAGTVALKKDEDGTVELTKMAVDEQYRGLGIGKLLCSAALEHAKRAGIKEVMLYSQRILKTALSIYEKNGFREIPLQEGKYKRANIMMKVSL